MLQTIYYDFAEQKKMDDMIKIKEMPEMSAFHIIHQTLPLPESQQNAICISDQEEICLEASGFGYPAILVDDQVPGSASMAIRYVTTSMEALSKHYLEEVYARYHKKPLEIFRTSRCIIRETCIEDLERFYEIYAGEGMTDFLEPLFEEYNTEKEYLESYIEHVYSFYGYGMWSIVEKESGKVIGRAGLESKEEPDSLELGYLIDRSHQRKGYATEVCVAILNYACEYLQVSEICSFIHPKNIASVSLCKKLGFIEQGCSLKDGENLCKYVWKQNS